VEEEDIRKMLATEGSKEVEGEGEAEGPLLELTEDETGGATTVGN
jgi:hypothetical protein